SGGREFTISPDQGTTINIIKSKASSCKVCKFYTYLRQCDNSLTLVTRTDVEFYCTTPEDIFKVEIVRKIGKTYYIMQSDVGFSNLLPFHRTFIWKIEADSQKSFQINFANTGLTQVAPSDSCINKQTYTLRVANILLGKFCSHGTIRSVTIRGHESFSLDLPAGQMLSRGQFNVSVVEKITTLAKISVTLEEGSLSSTLLTPNYPNSFPNNDLMEWYFQVPYNYRTAIKFLNLKQPTCLKDNVEVTYRNEGTSSQVVGLGDVQPEQKQGSFSLRLRNCQMDTRRPDGLSMKLTVTASPARVFLSFLQDTADMGIDNFKRKKTRDRRTGNTNKNNKPKEKEVSSCKIDLGFQNQLSLPYDDEFSYYLTIIHNMLSRCLNNASSILIICLLECCFQIQNFGLSNFNRTITWKFEADSQKSFQLNFANTGLTQIAPSDSCTNKQTYTLRVANILLGKFCSHGTIRSVTIRGHESFSLDLPAGQTLSRGQFNVSVVEKITTLAKISVTLEEGSLSSTLLTPNYPNSFPNNDLMEWYFQVPYNYKTAIKFLNLKQPTCLKDNAEVTYRNEGTSSQVVGLGDVQPEQKQGSFSLRLRNCQMDTRRPDGLSMNLTVTASPDTHLQTTLGVLAALVVSAAVVLMVVYIMMRFLVILIFCSFIMLLQSSYSLVMEVSVYNSGDTNIQTRLENFPEDCEDGIYSQIDETLIYSHFL
uniref:CUB domain-containing protein 1-like n=1 Tax=Poecilia formosa TaxID=48698 RepID=A0A087Y1G7_POEFO